MRDAEPIEFDELFSVRDEQMGDPSTCPECDGSLVADTPMDATGDGDGRVSRHCSSCGTSVDQEWTLVTVSIVGSDADRSFETRLEQCPGCGAPMDTVGNFFDHRDGSGRQEHSCTACDVEVDEWWAHRDTVEAGD
jgi:transcription elongation factor Elf1